MTTTPIDYEPSKDKWVRDQVDAILANGTTDGVEILGRPVVLITSKGARSGKTKLLPVMRVEHDGVYAAVASKGGAPQHPQWYYNLVAHPDVEVQDGTTVTPRRARLATPEEHEAWWPIAVAAYPPYAEYQTKTDRTIPIFLLEPR